MAICFQIVEQWQKGKGSSSLFDAASQRLVLLDAM